MVSVTVGDCAVDIFQMSCSGVIAVRKGQVNDSLAARMEVLMPEPQIYVERTLAIIKPDVIGKEEEIEDLILLSGFHIIQVTGCAPEKISVVYMSGKYLTSSNQASN